MIHQASTIPQSRLSSAPSPSSLPALARSREARPSGAEVFMFPKVSAVARTRPEGLVRFADSARSFAVALFASAVFLGAGYALFWKPVLDRWVF